MRDGHQGRRPKTPAWLDSPSAAPRPPAPRQPPRPPQPGAARGPQQPAGRTAFPSKPHVPAGPTIVQRVMAMKHTRAAIMGAGAVVLGLTAWSVLWGTSTSCRFNAARKAAVTMIIESRDQVTGEPLSERFSRGDFRCANLPAGADASGGVLVEAADGNDPVTWYFDAAGKPYNVNQLAAAWTPAFPESPRITTEQLSAVRD